jgi:hypothetical protein
VAHVAAGDAYADRHDAGRRELRDHRRCTARRHGLRCARRRTEPRDDASHPLDDERHADERAPGPVEPLDEPPARALEQGLHRRPGLAHLRGQLAIGQTPEFAEEHCLALPCRQVRELLLKAHDECVLGGELGRIEPAGRQAFRQRTLGTSRSRPRPRTTLVPCDLRKPSPRVERSHTFAERTVRTQEYLLRDVLGLVGVAHEDPTQPEDEGTMLYKELCIGVRPHGFAWLYPFAARADRWRSAKETSVTLETAADRVLGLSTRTKGVRDMARRRRRRRFRPLKSAVTVSSSSTTAATTTTTTPTVTTTS